TEDGHRGAAFAPARDRNPAVSGADRHGALAGVAAGRPGMARGPCGPPRRRSGIRAPDRPRLRAHSQADGAPARLGRRSPSAFDRCRLRDHPARHTAGAPARSVAADGPPSWPGQALMDPLLEQLLAGFVDEAQEIYDRVTRSLMELEKSPAQGPSFDELARGLHTLKGSSATLGLEELADLAHRMEDVVLPLRGSAQPLPGVLADAILKSLDCWMARLRATAAKADLPDLAPSLALLAAVKPAAPANAAAKAAEASAKPAEPAAKPSEVAVDLPPAPAANDDTQTDSWRVSTRQVIAPLHEVERLREVRLRLDERRRDLEKAVLQLDRLGIQAETAEARP